MAEDFVDDGSISIGDLAGAVYSNGDYIGRSIYRYLQHCCDQTGSEPQQPTDPRILFDCGQIQVNLSNPRLGRAPLIIPLQQEDDSVVVNLQTEAGVSIETESGALLEAEGEATLTNSYITDEQGGTLDYENDLAARYVVYNYYNGNIRPAYSLTQRGNNQFPQPDADGLHREQTVVYINDISPGTYWSEQFYLREPSLFVESKYSWYTEVVITRCDRDIIISEGSCDNLKISLGFDILNSTSNRGIASHWKFQVFRGDPFIYLRDGDIEEVEITDPNIDCLSTETGSCLLTELGNKILPQGFYRNIEYANLDCLLRENGQSIDDELGNCIQHLPHQLINQEEGQSASEEHCLHTESCEEIEIDPNGGECIAAEGFVLNIECTNESTNENPIFNADQIGSIKQYPIQMENGIEIFADNGEYLEMQGVFEVEGLETEYGDYINDEINGISIDRETRDDQLQTEEGRGIHFSYGERAAQAIEEVSELIYSSNILESRELLYNLGHGNYHITVNAYDEDNQPVLAGTINDLYISSCDCLETEAGTCINAENGLKIAPEYLALNLPDQFNPCALNVEFEGGLLFSDYNVETEEGEDILVQGTAQCHGELSTEELADQTSHELNLMSSLIPCEGYIETESRLTSGEELTTEAGQMIAWSIIDTNLTTEDCGILKGERDYELELN